MPLSASILPASPVLAPARKSSAQTVAAAQGSGSGSTSVSRLASGSSSSTLSASNSGAAPRAQRKLSSASTATVRGTDAKDKDKDKDGKGSGSGGGAEKLPYTKRSVPQLHKHNAESAPPTLMYWSRAPTWGTVPARNIRAHTATMVDHVAWFFGGCDEKECFRDVWCLDTETMEWTHPTMLGDIPDRCRAHTATLVDRKIVIFGGGAGHVYYNDLFVLDTSTRRWHRPTIPKDSPQPTPRRAHAAVLHRNRLIVFGGGNGTKALNDVWALDVSGPMEEWSWSEVRTHGKKPSPRGYHTANLVGDVMVIAGGSDGKASYHDIWCLNLDSNTWSAVSTDRTYRRLAHTSTQVGSYLFLMGGHDGGKYVNDLLLFNLVSLQYEARPTRGRTPTQRGYHTTVLADGRLFVFGGFNGHEVFDDCYILDLAGAAYLPQVTSFSINVE
ncbi:galactose oxidase [Rickenella mellea]|uniref:Galactose oxidase n=1 Tax=Rickenella mellea TaxID=50990 RepID=A0A4Y7QH43_9AGAM|nr:galactose oxidase [Rickenella mellea]